MMIALYHLSLGLESKQELLVQASYRRQKCSICIARYATKITYEDKYAPVTPGFWCSECYEAMHYDARGTLKDNHIVFPLPMTV